MAAGTIKLDRKRGRRREKGGDAGSAKPKPAPWVNYCYFAGLILLLTGLFLCGATFVMERPMEMGWTLAAVGWIIIELTFYFDPSFEETPSKLPKSVWRRPVRLWIAAVAMIASLLVSAGVTFVVLRFLS